VGFLKPIEKIPLPDNAVDVIHFELRHHLPADKDAG